MKSWQLVTVNCDEGDGLTLCERLSVMTALMVVFPSNCCFVDFPCKDFSAIS